MDYYFVMMFEDFKVFKENAMWRVVFFERCYIIESKFPLSTFFENFFHNLYKTLKKEKLL